VDDTTARTFLEINEEAEMRFIFCSKSTKSFVVAGNISCFFFVSKKIVKSRGEKGNKIAVVGKFLVLLFDCQKKSEREKRASEMENGNWTKKCLTLMTGGTTIKDGNKLFTR
jgi:hypothetical protein